MNAESRDTTGQPIEQAPASDGSLEQVLRQLARAPEYSFDETAGQSERTGEPRAVALASEAVPRLDGYELMEELGRGGMGAVYKARQKGTGRLVAVKVILGRRSQNPEAVRRFDREIRLLGRLQHPCIAAIHAAGATAEGDPYFAMELVEGVTLDRHLAQEPSLRRRLEVFRKVCDAVAHSHRLGVIHRDLKPQNVMVCSGGSEVKVLDFGLGRIVSAEPEDAPSQTAAGLVQGTLAYMSPEQASGGPVSTLSDLYSLGVLLYELTTGKCPYDVSSRSLPAALRVICEASPRPPSKVVPGLHRKRDLDALVLKALEKSPALRYQTVSELSKDVENYLTNRPILRGQVHERAFRTIYTLGLFCRRNLVAVLVAAAATGALSALGLWSFHNVEQQRLRAEASAKTSTRLLASLYESEGRQVLASGDASRAAVYFGEAYRLGKSDPTLRLLLGLGARALQLEPPRIFEERPGVFDRATLSPDGQRLLTIGVKGSVNVWNAIDGKKLTTLSSAVDWLSSAAFSPDGTRVVTNSRSGSVQIWDPLDGRILGAMESAGPEAASPLRTAGFSPDGSRVAAAGRLTRVWDARSAKLLFSVASFPTTRGIPVFSPDGGKILVGGASLNEPTLTAGMSGPSELQLLDAATGKLLTAMKQEGVSVSPRFSPDGARILAQSTGSDEGPALFDAASGDVLLSIRNPEARASHKAMAALSSDGTRIVTASGFNPLRVWNAADGSLLATLEGDGKGFFSPGFSPDGRYVVSGSFQGELHIWDSVSGHELASLSVPSLWLAVFSPDGQHILSADNGRTSLSRLPAADLPVTIQAASSGLVDAEFSRDGAKLSTESDDGHARLWDARTGRQIGDFEVPGTTWDATFHPDGRWMVNVFDSQGCRIFEAQSGKLVAKLEGPVRGSLESVRFTPDGLFLLAMTAQGGLKAWSLQSGQTVVEITGKADDSVSWVVASPDGSRILAPAAEIDAAKRLHSTVGPALLSLDQSQGLSLRRSRSFLHLISRGPSAWKLLDGPSGQTVATLEGLHSNAAAFSPDGSKALIVRGTVVEVLDAATGKSEATIDPSWGPSTSAAFSPDASWIALGSAAGQVRLVETSGGSLVASFRLSAGNVTYLTFSPDGSRLAASLGSNAVSILELPLEQRGPEAYAQMLRCLAPWRLQDGRLVAARPPGGCSP